MKVNDHSIIAEITMPNYRQGWGTWRPEFTAVAKRFEMLGPTSEVTPVFMIA
jgi:hypothetical protein